jgi:hypothetical protein
MPDVVIVVEQELMGAGNASKASGLFRVQYVRLKSDADKQLLLSGRPLAGMGQSSVLEHGEIRPPDGSPPDPGSVGQSTISSLQEAKQVAVTALANHNSEVRVKGLHPSTAVYHWKHAAPADRLA